MIKILLDSGAYSAWTLGIKIKPSKYIEYVKANLHLLELYVSLDVIPGERGRRSADPDRIERAAKKSYRNHQIMKDEGLTPTPVFHQDDRFYWLDRYLTDGETYIALAPHGVHAHNIIGWLDQCFMHIGNAKVKVHGLGVSSAFLLRRYPFTSVDSNTWAQQAGHGQILVPLYVGGRPDYSYRPLTVSVSERSVMRSNHVDQLGPCKRQRVEQFLVEEVGVQLSTVRDDVSARWRATITYFRELADNNNVQLFFVTGLSRTMQQALMQCGAHRHLLSYLELRKRGENALERYVEGQWK